MFSEWDIHPAARTSPAWLSLDLDIQLCNLHTSMADIWYASITHPDTYRD